jgi:hypothetical protein
MFLVIILINGVLELLIQTKVRFLQYHLDFVRSVVSCESIEKLELIRLFQHLYINES